MIGILLFAFLIRVYRLNQLPKILNRDAAALAYNALLLRKTGQDEWRQAWPISFKSFGDYKLPGYIYSLLGLFQILPMNDWVVRLPSALAGVALCWLAYQLAKELRLSLKYRLILAGLVATSPVYIFFSRMAFEANLALSLLVASLLSLIKATNMVHEQQPAWRWDLLAVGLSMLAILTYNTPLLLLPFIIISLPWLRGLKSLKKWWLPVVGLALVFTFGAYQLFSVSSQKSGITIFQDETVWLQSVAYRHQFSGWQQTVFGNRYLFYAGIIAEHYLQSFSPQFLLEAQGGHPWHSIPQAGHLYVLVYGLSVVGLVVWLVESLVDKKTMGRDEPPTRYKRWILYLLMISLLPAVVTVDAPHATRSLLFFLLILVLAVVGFKKIDQTIFRDRRHIWLWLFLCLISVETGGYLYQYFQQYPHQHQVLKPGLSTVLEKIEESYPEQSVAVVDPEGYQYIILAWYLKLSPEEFFQSVIKQQADRIGLQYGQQVGRYHFVAQATDRVEQEKLLLSWSGREWQLEEF